MITFMSLRVIKKERKGYERTNERTNERTEGRTNGRTNSEPTDGRSDIVTPRAAHLS